MQLVTAALDGVSLSWYAAHGSNASSADFFRVSVVHSGGTTVLYPGRYRSRPRWCLGEAGVDDVKITKQ